MSLKIGFRLDWKPFYANTSWADKVIGLYISKIYKEQKCLQSSQPVPLV